MNSIVEKMVECVVVYQLWFDYILKMWEFGIVWNVDNVNENVSYWNVGWIDCILHCRGMELQERIKGCWILKGAALKWVFLFWTNRRTV